MNEEQKKARVPTPPHPSERREPLPWQRPKPTEEDPQARQRIQTILDSPSYREADKDVDFLDRDDIRGLRLQVDYLKAELLLEQNAIRHTIVVFGGTRIRERAAVERQVEQLRRAQVTDPTNTDVAHRLEIAERLLAKSHYYDVARELGRLVGSGGQEGKAYDLVVMTGGGPGIMEAANRGAHDAGAKSNASR